MTSSPFTSRWHQAFCHVGNLDPAEWPEDRCHRLNRYGFLRVFELRTDEEEAEAQRLHAEFASLDWGPVAPRSIPAPT